MRDAKRVSICCLVFCFLTLFFTVPALAEIGARTPEKQTAIDWIDENENTYDEVAVYIWEHPELGFVELKSAAKLQDYLVSHGFTVEKGMSGIDTAFVATWGSGKPVIGFIGEFDALPNLSQERGATEEKPIVAGAPGHGCGHNLYGASGATAAIATAKAMERHNIEGTIKFYGTPGEEAGDAKVFMVRDGAWDDCDVVISWHPGDRNAANYETNLAIRTFKVAFHGRSAHAGASPHMGRSALDGVELFNIGMNYMREHTLDQTRIQYVITSGGEAPNNVPPFAEVWYFMRAPHMPIIDQMYDWMKMIAEGAALMTQTKAEVKLQSSCWERLTNRTLTRVGDANLTLIGAPPFTEEDQAFGEKIAAALAEMGAEGIEAPYYDTEIERPELDQVFPDVTRKGSSADTGDVSWTVPLLSFSAATHVKNSIGHNWVQVSQNAMPPALKAGLTVSKWMAASALDLLSNPQILEEARAEHREYLERTPYHPVPKELSPPTFFDMYGRDWESVPKPPTYKN